MAEQLLHGPGQLTAPPPLSLYIHLPWCVRKCPYCDFNSHALRDDLPEDAYIAALLRDLEGSLPQIWGRRVETVFFGGGTPSLFSPDGINRLLSEVRARVPLAPLAEITLEANPGTLEAGRFGAFRAAGITRLSLGIQSFEARQLTALGRIHDAAQARRAAELAARHFETFNLDLMYALPAQGLAELRRDLDMALGFAPPHLSYYHLTLESNTPFGHTPPPGLPDDDLAADMQALIEARTSEAGLDHYETSAYTRPGHRCRHNLNYWSFGDYLGIGAGAHSKLSLPEGIVREARVRHPRQYLDALMQPSGMPAGTHISERRRVAARELPFEFMLNALRLSEGVDVELFTARTGLPRSTLAAPLARARAQGLMQDGDARLQASPLGARFLNDLLQMFL